MIPDDRRVRALHAMMIDRLVERGYITTARVEEAFRAVPRHPFVPGVSLEQVYSGDAIVTRSGRDGMPTSSSSEPAIMAVMIEQLGPAPGDRVLEVGAGTGYNAAILAFLAGDEGAVVTVDLDEEIVREAREHLHRAGVAQVDVVAADGWAGMAAGAPHDRIEVTVGVSDLSPHWVDQLREGGVLLVPLWLRGGLQASIAFRREGQRLRSTSVEPCGFMRLRGAHAGPEGYLTVNGWCASLEEVSAAAATLGDLLRRTPRAVPAPDLPRGWFTRLALEEPAAIMLSGVPDWHRSMAGIFDAAGRSLAVVDGQTIMSFGGDEALVRLRERLTGLRPLDLRALRVEATPAGQPVWGKTWVLRRRHFQFAIDEGTAPVAREP